MIGTYSCSGITKSVTIIVDSISGYSLWSSETEGSRGSGTSTRFTSNMNDLVTSFANSKDTSTVI